MSPKWVAAWISIGVSVVDTALSQFAPEYSVVVGPILHAFTAGL